MSRFWRWYDYFSTGFTTYINRPLGVLNFVLIVRMYLAEYAPEILNMMPILKNFVAFFVLAAVVVGASSLLSGWYDIKRRPFKIRTLQRQLENPVAMKNAYLHLDTLIRLRETHDIPVPDEFYRMRDFYRKRDQEIGWKPPAS